MGSEPGLSGPGQRAAAPAEDRDPPYIGPFRLIEVLGEGGMGRVYLAEQTEPVQRQVALKLLRRSLLSPRAREHLEAERRALARLAHPHVAQMLEAGTTVEGHPYFAMERVEGRLLNIYCDEEELTIADRLKIFCDICAGVHHAHVRHILHQDLKPSNLMVAEIDGRPVVKIIDFGIARSLDDPLGGSPESRQIGGSRTIIGTPAYMSPEALDGMDGPGVDTRADIFSLGIVLYELLVEARPTTCIDPLKQRLELESGTWPDPSARLDSSQLQSEGFDLERIAARRRLTPAALKRRLAGDLDAIVAKAIATDRERRYQSAVELADDIERHLIHQPVRARRSTPKYLFSRWLRRNRTAVVAASLVLITLLGGFISRGLEARRANLAAAEAQRALAEAEDLSEFILGLFDTANPDSEEGDSLSALLDRGRQTLDDELAQSPITRARFATQLGHIYAKLAELDIAEDLLRESLNSLASEPTADPFLELGTRQELATVFRRQGRLDEAEAMIGPVILELHGMELGDVDKENRRLLALAHSLNDQGNIFWQQERLLEAEEAYRKALALKENLLGQGHHDVGLTLNNLGIVLTDLGRHDEARARLERSVTVLGESLGADHPWLASTLGQLATLARYDGRWQEAEDVLRRSTEIYLNAYGAEHPTTIRAVSRLAQVLFQRQCFEESLALREENLKALLPKHGWNYDRMRREFLSRAQVRARLGDFDGAFGDFYRSQSSWEKRILDGERGGIENAQDGRGDAGRAGEPPLPRSTDPEATYRRLLEGHAARLGPGHEVTQVGRAWLGWILHLQGKAREATTIFQNLYDHRLSTQGPDHLNSAWAAAHLAYARLAAGGLGDSDTAEVEGLLSYAVDLYQQWRGPYWPEVGRLRLHQALMAAEAGRHGEARQRREEAAEIFSAVLEPDDPILVEIRAEMAASGF